MGHVVAGHGGNAQDGDGARALKVHGLFIAGGQAAVQIARVAAVGGHLFHGDGHFLLGVGVVGHIRQQHQDPLSGQGELLRHGQGHIGHQGALHGGVGGGVDEHHRAAHGTALFQGVPEVQIVVVLQAHAAQDDHVHLGLHGAAGEQLVIRLAGHGEDGQLLAFHQGVEHVDHGDTGADQLVGHDTLGRVHGGAADGDHVLRQGGAVVPGDPGAVEDAAQQVVGEGHHHGAAQETDRVRGADALGAAEHLQRHQVLVQLDDVGIAVAHQGQVAVADAGGPDRDNVAHDGLNFRVNFLHIDSPLNPLPCSGKSP